MVVALHDGQAAEVSKSADGGLFEPPAVSRDDSRVDNLARRDRKRRLVAALPTDALPELSRPRSSLGAVGQSAGGFLAGWTSIIAGAERTRPRMFKISVESGEHAAREWSGGQTTLVTGWRFDCLCRQDFHRSSRTFGGTAGRHTRAISPPATIGLVGTGSCLTEKDCSLPVIRPSIFGVLILRRSLRQLTRLGNHGALGTFDIRPDGRRLCLIACRKSDIVLIELTK